MKVNIKKLDPRAVIPSYAKPGDMGMDLTAISVEYKEDIDCYVYHTGLAFEIPEGYGMLIVPRSSNRKTDAYMPNHCAIIDSGYRGEVMICFKNRTRIDICLDRDDLDCDYFEHDDDYAFIYAPYLRGERIAQLVIIPYPQIKFNEVEELSETERGKGGFGSTNK